MVEGTGFENRQGRKLLVGSNPTLSAQIMTQKNIFIGTALIGLFLFVFISFGAPRVGTMPEQFVVSRGATLESISNSLAKQGFVRSALAFHIYFHLLDKGKTVSSGGYYISSSMSAWTIARTLVSRPEMKWVVIPEGLRKEEIAGIISSALGWASSTEAEFLSDTNTNPDYVEGVYFPETYLIPVSDSPSDVVTELVSQFNKEFAPYANEAINKNIKWTTALTLASIIQREAANDTDMPLISGILWNRLLQNMPLDVDSTVQYAKGQTALGWWAPLSAGDTTNIDSPFNTYTHTGIPPHPISNPGIAAISAALNPATTTCLYYLHDSNRIIHCADTLDQQENNIVKYLK